MPPPTIGERQAGQRVEQMQRLQELEHRDEDRLRRDHHRADEGVEDHLASGKAVAGEGVGRRRREGDDQRDGEARDVERVAEMHRKVHREPDAREVLPLELCGQDRVEDLVRVLHRGDDHPDERERLARSTIVTRIDVDERAGEDQRPARPRDCAGERCGSIAGRAAGHSLAPHISIWESRSRRRPRRIWIAETTMLSSRMTIAIAVA